MRWIPLAIYLVMGFMIVALLDVTAKQGAAIRRLLEDREHYQCQDMIGGGEVLWCSRR